jgi:hypothetical protein
VVIETVPSVPVPKEPASLPREKESGDEAGFREITPVTAPRNPGILNTSAPDLPVTGSRKVIPADPDIPLEESRATALTGAGTDIPMPWDNPRDRKAQHQAPSPAHTGESSKTGTAPPSPGVIARIISLVQSLFNKRK